ncbi:MAG: arabinogalactan endo-1,4-beta-galactosidase [Lachnospiraceae bacterium]|nr:arabinogalactan endo-1,4-beta-galactosidase [Lachnospiraceae bacterium]
MAKFAYGVDLGWASQLEAQGYHWVNGKGEAVDPYEEAKNMGANAARFRVFVNPPKGAYWQKRDGSVCMLGFCDIESVCEQARRAKAHGMEIMIDLHYSDHFADPQYQEIPADWLTDDEKTLCEKIKAHTLDVLTALKEAGITPRWVQVGNEINPGILLPKGSLQEAPETLVKFLNAGYEAVKAFDEKILVVTHLAGAQMKDECESFLENFFAHDGKTDILGFSYYPYWFGNVHRPEAVAENLQRYHRVYQKPVLIAEIGEAAKEEEKTYRIIRDIVAIMKEISGEEESGVFYWEPEVSGDEVVDGYPLGASRMIGEKTLCYTKALEAYRDSEKTD